MALTIQHNLSAVNARNKMNTNVSGLGKSAEKLSSGYQINRSADNASGLAVSEKLRSQIRGLSQATNNSNDGISLIQTAEGALSQTADILQRMRELAVQSANGTYTDSDREAIQLEVDALKSEIDRISESTEYNTIKLLDGSLNVSLNSELLDNEYGALYGSINYGLAIGGGKITVTSSIQGMYLEFTTNASGAGGENAVWCYDYERTGGDLTQHIVINLAEGQSYTDEEIQKLIDNATVPKNFEAATGKITFSSEYGIIQAANDETYGLKIGSEKQKISVNTGSIATQSTYRTDEWSVDGTQSFTVYWGSANDDEEYEEYMDGSKLYLDSSKTYTTNDILSILIANGWDTNGTGYGDDFFDSIDYSDISFGNGDETISYDSAGDGTTVEVNYTSYYLKDVTEYHQTYSFTLTANQYGSYSEYLADEEKYSQEDCADYFNMQALSGVQITVSDSADEDISCSVVNDQLVVTLKQGYTSSSPSEITSAIQSYLNDNGYNYTVTAATSYTGKANSNGTAVLISTFIADSGTSTGTITTEGLRYVARTGTVAGIRQVIEGDLTSLVGDSSNGAIDSSDYITFTADTYGRSSDYDSLVSSFIISTDVGEGDENVEINNGTATIHLSTGVRYSQSDIEALISEAGLSYSVSLTDKNDPDGSKDGYVYFNQVGTSAAIQTVAGQGVGIEDVSTVTEGITFQIGANGTEDQQVTMKVQDAGAEALGIADIDVSTVDSANEAINTVDNAIQQISMQRASLGALQNRLEYTVNNLTTSGENLTSSESQIRDTDMAVEMINYTKYNILQQASQAMLAQANQQPQSVLQLLG